MKTNRNRMGSATTSFRLDSDFTPRSGGAGAIALTLYNLGDRPIANFRLALTSLFRVKTGSEITGGKIFEQISNYHVIAPPEGFRLEPGAAWSISADQLSHPLTHYNFGPSVRAGTQPLRRRTDRGGRRWRGRCCGPMPEAEKQRQHRTCNWHRNTPSRLTNSCVCRSCPAGPTFSTPTERSATANDRSALAKS